MNDRPLTDGEWFGIRAAARQRNWHELERRAKALGWPTVAEHARRASNERCSREVIAAALLLDRPDEPDLFWDEHGNPRARGDVNVEWEPR